MEVSFFYNRFISIQSSRSSRLYILFDRKEIIRPGFRFHCRTIHLAGLFQSAIKIFPIYFLTGIAHTSATGGRGFKRIEIRIILYPRWRRGKILFKSRNIRHVFRIKINGRNRIEFPQRFFDSRRNNLPDSLLVLKFNFRFSRMNIHIDIGRIHFKIKKIRNLLTYRDQLFISLHHRLMEIGMPHITAIHKEILMCPFLARRFRLSNITGKFDHRCIHIHTQ